jgi:hypothetical protein
MAPYKDEPSILLNKDPKDPTDLEAGTEETTSLLSGYGAVTQKDGVQTPFNASEDFPLDSEEVVSPATRRNRALKRWGWIGAGAILYVVGIMAWNGSQSNKTEMSLGSQEAVDVELLGSSKKKDKDKKSKKPKKPAFEPVSYPSCPSGVELTYIKQALPFEMHEMAAEASDCHLASIHNMEEQEKYSKAGLFKVAYGPEIGMSFAGGKPLTKTFWLGGRFGADMDAWEWTDNSTWDFGPNSTSVEGCLASTFSFLEIAMPVIAPEDHWSVVDCNTPLPAIYKCCIPTPSPSAYPTEAPTDAPTAPSTASLTDAPVPPEEGEEEEEPAPEESVAEEEDTATEDAVPDDAEKPKKKHKHDAGEEAAEEDTAPEEEAEESDAEEGEPTEEDAVPDDAEKPKKKHKHDADEEAAEEDTATEDEDENPAEEDAVTDDAEKQKKNHKHAAEEEDGAPEEEEKDEAEESAEADNEKPKKKHKHHSALEEPEEDDTDDDTNDTDDEEDEDADEAAAAADDDDDEKPKKKHKHEEEAEDSVPADAEPAI